MENKKAWILHIDGDGFFAYCEIARFPHLKGKPVVVGQERGIACAMTYEAKALGITRAMPIFKIREQFPQVVVLSSHFELYEHYARMLASLVEPKVAVLERYSIDECFALVHFPQKWSKGELSIWLASLKSLVQRSTGLTYSFGLARTKVLAKVASKHQKPDGCTVIVPEEEAEVLAETAISSLWGIGWRLAGRLQQLQVTTALQFAKWPYHRVQQYFSLPVQELWRELHGTSVFHVAPNDALPHSLQSTRSFTPASADLSFITAELLHNADTVFSRMRNYGMLTNACSIYLKSVDHRYERAALSLPYYTDNPLSVADIIARQAARLFRKGTRYRSSGITVWNLRQRQHTEDDLFGVQAAERARGTLMGAVDGIRTKFGKGSIMLASTLPSITERRRKKLLAARGEAYLCGLPLPYLGEVS